MSFCCLTYIYIYWSNSKMTPIIYDYTIECMAKREHYLEWYDVAINRIIKTYILLCHILNYGELNDDYTSCREIVLVLFVNVKIEAIRRFGSHLQLRPCLQIIIKLIPTIYCDLSSFSYPILAIARIASASTLVATFHVSYSVISKCYSASSGC